MMKFYNDMKEVHENMNTYLKPTLNFSGKLIKNNLEKTTDKNGYEVIRGNVVLRTTDGSEHRVNVYENKFKTKWENGKMSYTNEENPKYKGLETVSAYQDISQNPESNVILSYRQGTIKENRYLNKDGELYVGLDFNTSIFSSDTSKINPDNLEFAFDIPCIVKNVEINEYNPDEKIISVLALSTSGTKGDYSLYDCFPVDLVVPKELVTDFDGVGYYEGCFANFFGTIKNQVIETVIPSAFGKNKTETKYIKGNYLVGGYPPRSIDELEITQDMLDMVQEKRRVKLESIKQNGGSNTSTANVSNPFGGNNLGGFGNTNMANVPFNADNMPKANPFAPF